MKEALVTFDARNVLTIFNNSLPESIKTRASFTGQRGNLTIANNTRLRMSALRNCENITADETYRKSDGTAAKFIWSGIVGQQLHLDGYSGLDFL